MPKLGGAIWGNRDDRPWREVGLASTAMHRTDVMTKSDSKKWGKPPWKITFRTRGVRLPQRADFVVVGGGFVGLSAAAWLARLAPRKSVLLLEAGSIGNGASGRTGGMALAETAAGNLPGLGDVLRGYRKILWDLRVDAELNFPGAWEVARGDTSMEGKRIHPLKNSPIEWNDSGTVRAVAKAPGGTINPGKVVSGLARAAAKYGALVVEHAQVFRIEFSDPVKLCVRQKIKGSDEDRIVTAERVLLATNAGSRGLAGTIYGVRDSAEPRLTFAIATAPLTKEQIVAIGMASGRPFYTVDHPYLWGRLTRSQGMIFGSGLVPAFGRSLRADADRTRSAKTGVQQVFDGLERFDIRRGESAARLRSLERRVRFLHPALKNVRITHRWAGPILTTKDFMPTFCQHPDSENTIVLGGFSGHGVALSVYLGKWAARTLVGKRKLPDWY